YGGTPGAGRIEVVEFSPRDGSVTAIATVDVTLEGYPGSGYIESPAPLAKVTLPVGVMARVGTPGEQVNITIAWEDGTQFATVVPTVRGSDGRGLVVTALDWVGSSQPPMPDTQMGVIQIHTLTGSPLAIQPVTILNPQDPDTMSTKVYWVLGEQVQAQTIRIPKTQGIGRASLEMLLWGPTAGNLAGFTSAIPSPAEILSYPGRAPGWGERVRLNSLTITDGVARVDFSEELTAHSGGTLRVSLLREQIAATLLQFPTVKEVVITVDGATDALEP
ncbi:MAG: GerMN domain-containing protein, partial [Candidatus Eisenbacteria bacterium]|nr:GerMN domain-containing protein [Candidatus Eisenbacteria bacterium]